MKVPTSVYIDNNLKEVAKKKKINLSQELENALRNKISPEELLFDENITLKKQLKGNEEEMKKYGEIRND